MAGVAPQQRGGSNATTIGMIVSIVVAVALLGVLIWLITQQEQLRTTADQATAAKIRADKDNSEKAKAIQLLCSRLSGNADDGAANAVSKLNAAIEKITSEEKLSGLDRLTSGNGMTANLELLYQVLLEGQSARDKADAERAKLNAALESAEARNKSLQQNFGDELKKLGTRVEELQAAKTEFEKVKSSEIETLATQIGAKQDELNNVRQQRAKLGRLARTELDNRDRLLDEQKKALTSLRGPPAEGAQELASARRPVGTVLRALPGDSLVHIDLGREDNVALGMTFSIYSAGERVPADGRGKSQVEVVSLGRRTSECRVTSPPSPDDPILDGDLAGNIILSRDRGKKQRFCVVGAFDIDFDGQVDASGTTAIKSLIEKYGGVVVDKVDATTDYVVVGMEPAPSQDELEPTLPVKPAAKPAVSPEEESEDAPASETSDEPAAEDSGDEAEGEADEEEPADADSGDAESSGDEGATEEEGGEDSGDASDEGSEEGSDEDADKPADSGDGASEEGEGEGEGEEGASEEGATDEEKKSGDDEAAPADEEAASTDAAEDGAEAVEEKPEETAKKGAVVSEPEEPAEAHSPESFEMDLTTDTRKLRGRGDRAKYEEALRRAEQLAIPRLPADRFYNFVGMEAGPDAANRLAP
jgi:hypothetical protein